MADYLHGIETVNVDTGSRPVAVVRTAIIGLVGIAPQGAKNTPILVTSDTTAAQFGSKVPGFSIPQSLDAIFAQGAGTVVVVNVFDSATHTTAVTAEAHTVTDGKIKLAFAPIGAVTITDVDDEPVAYVDGEDYTIDEYGNLTVLGNGIANATPLKFAYSKLNTAAITDALIVGTITGGVRTGLKCFDLCYNLFGFNPKIMIAPYFSHTAAVAAELHIYANKYLGIDYIDAPLSTTVAGAIAGRGPAGTINFNTAGKMTELLFPRLKRYNAGTNETELVPYSAFKAGLRAAVDNAEGYWVSDSNHAIAGITGTEIELSASMRDSGSDTNLLNGAGISTVFNTFGSGLKAWGNRNASFPGNMGADSFTCVQRVSNIIQDSIEFYAMQRVDQPITNAWIDTVREDVNGFLRVLYQRGALIGGECKYRAEDNSVEQLAKGNVVFYYDSMSPTPAERITFKKLINVDYLKSLIPTT